LHLRDGSYPGAKSLGHGRGYVYAHDAPHAIAAQSYLPDSLAGSSYYAPTDRGAEANMGERWERIQRILRGE
jgi:putative ATPase